MGSIGSATFNISVVIPALDAEDYLPELLKAIEAQTLLPNEIVIVDSSSSGRTVHIVANWKGKIPIVHKTVDFAYPGHARNLGVELARGEWVAFMDCRTLPSADWLETSASIAKASGADLVRALCEIVADTRFKGVMRAATYGQNPFTALPGSMVRKSVFQRSGGFASNVRAGEDLEWMHRLEYSGVKFEIAAAPAVRYFGLPESLPKAIGKWFRYAIANADIEVRNNHKAIYLLILTCVMFVVAYRWNAVMAGGENERSIYYLPNVTKIFLATLFASYLGFRGIIRPLQLNEKLSYLLPWRWLQIGVVGLCLDLAKAPGLIWGAILLLGRRIGSARRYFGTHEKSD